MVGSKATQPTPGGRDDPAAGWAPGRAAPGRRSPRRGAASSRSGGSSRLAGDRLRPGRGPPGRRTAVRPAGRSLARARSCKRLEELLSAVWPARALRLGAGHQVQVVRDLVALVAEGPGRHRARDDEGQDGGRRDQAGDGQPGLRRHQRQAPFDGAAPPRQDRPALQEPPQVLGQRLRRWRTAAPAPCAGTSGRSSPDRRAAWAAAATERPARRRPPGAGSPGATPP